MNELDPTTLEHDHPLEPSERDLVQAWRVMRLIDLGYDVDRAIDAATSQLDVHDVEHLLERGCTLPTALEILL